MPEFNASISGTQGVASDRAQSRAEELANSISHGAGFIATLVASPPLIMHAAELGNARFLAGAIIFAATMMMLYLASTIYHVLPSGRAKHIIRVIEHSAIFLLIAGTYTPFTLGVLHHAWGWTLFGLIWALATIGVVLKIIDAAPHPLVSSAIYLAMGWLTLVVIDPSFKLIPGSGLTWLVAGGLAYTVGAVFFIVDSRLRYGHFIWHLFVITGTTCHYCAVFWYAA